MGRLDLAVDLADLELDQRQLRMLRGIERTLAVGMEALMAQLEGINAALDDLGTQITQVADQIAQLEAGTVTQEELDAVEARVRAMAGDVDALIEPDPGEGGQPEPVPGDGGGATPNP